MSKEKYLEMCEMLGEAVDENNLPVELDDFPVEVQEALLLYRSLKDEYDTFNGDYLGKNFTGIVDYLEVMGIDKQDKRNVLDLIRTIDSVRKEQYKLKKAQQPA